MCAASAAQRTGKRGKQPGTVSTARMATIAQPLQQLQLTHTHVATVAAVTTVKTFRHLVGMAHELASQRNLNRMLPENAVRIWESLRHLRTYGEWWFGVAGSFGRRHAACGTCGEQRQVYGTCVWKALRHQS